MQHTALFLALLMVVGATAPLAAAQIPNKTTTEVEIQPSSEPATPGSQLALPGKVTYTYPGTGQMELSGTEITFKVIEQPEWATVVVNPTSLVMPVDGQEPFMVVSRSANFNVQIHVAPDAPAGESAVVTIRAVAAHNGHLESSAGESSTLLATTSDDPCTAASSTEEMTVQGATTEAAGFLGLAPAQAAAVLGIGATATVAGVFIGRRFGNA